MNFIKLIDEMLRDLSSMKELFEEKVNKLQENEPDYPPSDYWDVLQSYETLADDYVCGCMEALKECQDRLNKLDEENKKNVEACLESITDSLNKFNELHKELKQHQMFYGGVKKFRI